jgi:gliding-associated putative ABC transporter substrate-binding component GldG
VPSVVGSVGGQPQIELLPWPYSPLLRNTSGHPIAKNLDFVASSFPQSIDTIATPGIRKEVLLSSSAYSRTLQTPALVEWRSIRTEQDLQLFTKQNIPVAVLLEGNFTSAFSNRVSLDETNQLSAAGMSFLNETKSVNGMVVLSDGDILLNPINEQEGPLSMGMNSYTRQPFANKDFVQNCLEYLINENGLSEAKAKDYVVRLLDTKKVNEQKTMWQVINIAVPVLLVILFALVFQWIRRKKYSK